MTRPRVFGAWLLVAVVSAALLSACRSSADPAAGLAPGSAVSMATKDGKVIEGEVVTASQNEIVVRTANGGSQSIPRARIATVQPRPVPEYLEVAVPAGTVLKVELETPLASNTAAVEQRVEGRTLEPVVVDRREVIPAGSDLVGTVAMAHPAGKFKGHAQLAFRFEQIVANGVTYDIDTRTLSYATKGTGKQSVAKIGLGAGAGAVVGALVGGGKGAAIGSAIGGGAGTAVVMMTPGKEVSLPSGMPVSVSLQEGFSVRVKR